MYNPRVKFPKIDRYINTNKLLKLQSSILINMGSDRATVYNHIDVKTYYDIDKYKLVSKTRWNPYKNEPILNASELCYTWRKIVNSDISRQTAVLELFKNHPKIIIFYNFDYELDILKQLVWGDDVEVAEWNGHKHQNIPQSKKWVYLVQYTSGCEGWNCIITDTIIFYSQNYSYKVMLQAAGRTDRINTPFEILYYYHLKSNSGIDLAISNALSRKKIFNENKYIERRK